MPEGTAVASSLKTKYDFPVPGSRKAPKFKGHYSQLDDFFEQFETLATSCNLTDEDKFKFLPKYVSSNIRETIEGMKEFKEKKDWNGLVSIFKELYNYDKVAKKFREKDLSQFVKEYKEKSMKNLEKFNKYQRKFTRIAGWLLSKKKITEEESRKYFWKGLPKSTRSKLESRMLQVDQNLDRSTPYSMEKIIAAAKHVFDTSKFYDDDSSESDSDSDSSDGSDSESGSEDEDEDEDEEDKKISRKAKASKKNSK
ncbi:hypothetical protein M422DRAFT_192430, partial [Sphaerobolus stellatus SS14]